MAREIQIPGYEVVVPNMWWRKDLHGGKQRMSVLMRMMRYDVPTSEQIIECIRGRAAKVNYEHLVRIRKGEAVKTAVETALSTMPECVFEEFRKGNEQLYRHLGKHINYGTEQPGKRYLDMDRWVVPATVFEMAREFPDRSLPTQDEQISSMMHRYGQKERGFLMMLGDKSMLPEAKAMDSLLEAEVRSSRQFSTPCSFDDYSKIARDVRQIYSVLESSGAGRVCDTSDDYLQIRGLGALGDTWQCMQIKGILGAIPQIFLAINQEETKQGKKLHPKGPFNVDMGNFSCEN